MHIHWYEFVFAPENFSHHRLVNNNVSNNGRENSVCDVEVP